MKLLRNLTKNAGSSRSERFLLSYFRFVSSLSRTGLVSSRRLSGFVTSPWNLDVSWKALGKSITFQPTRVSKVMMLLNSSPFFSFVFLMVETVPYGASVPCLVHQDIFVLFHRTFPSDECLFVGCLFSLTPVIVLLFPSSCWLVFHRCGNIVVVTWQRAAAKAEAKAVEEAERAKKEMEDKILQAVSLRSRGTLLVAMVTPTACVVAVGVWVGFGG